MKLDRWTSDVQRTQRKDNKSTSTLSSKKGWWIQSRNRCFRTCNRRSIISRIRREMETYSVFIQDNTTSKKELQDLWQGIISNSRNLNKMETIFIGCYRKVWSLDRPWKSQIFQETSHKINMKANILSRKDQVNIKDNNKNIQILKEELWARQQITADIKVI